MLPTNRHKDNKKAYSISQSLRWGSAQGFSRRTELYLFYRTLTSFKGCRVIFFFHSSVLITLHQYSWVLSFPFYIYHLSCHHVSIYMFIFSKFRTWEKTKQNQKCNHAWIYYVLSTVGWLSQSSLYVPAVPLQREESSTCLHASGVLHDPTPQREAHWGQIS